MERQELLRATVIVSDSMNIWVSRRILKEEIVQKTLSIPSLYRYGFLHHLANETEPLSGWVLKTYYFYCSAKIMSSIPRFLKINL